MIFKHVAIGDLVELSRGYNPPKSEFINEPREGYIRFIQIRDAKNDKNIVYVPDSKKLRKVENDDILLVAYRHVGNAFRGMSGAINVALCRLRNMDEAKLLSDYLFHMIPTDYIKGELLRHSERSLIPSMSVKHLAEIKIPLPPLPEQKRIVALLDSVFADLEQTRAKTEQNLKNARELFDSYLQQVFSQKADGWEIISLGEVADLVDSLHITPKYIDEGGLPMVRVTEIKRSGLSLKKAKRVDQETYEKFSKRHKSCVGDIILSRVGASYGIPVIVETDEVFCLGQNTVFILPKINSYWLYYFLLSPVAKEQIDSFVAGSAQPTVSMKSIRQLIVPIPSKLEQDRIEPEIKKVLSQSNQLIEIYQKKLNSIDELKKSILQKAFSGQLTSNINKGMNDEV